MKVGLNSPYTPGETPSIPNIEMPTLSLKLYENQARALNYEMQEPKKKKKKTHIQLHLTILHRKERKL